MTAHKAGKNLVGSQRNGRVRAGLIPHKLPGLTGPVASTPIVRFAGKTRFQIPDARDRKEGECSPQRRHTSVPNNGLALLGSYAAY